MARYFAELKDNIVQRVVVCDTIEWLQNNLGGEWIETFMDKLDHNYAGKGYTYYSDKKNFIPPKPFLSAVLDDKCQWQTPKEYPKDGKMYWWNEKLGNWVEVKSNSIALTGE